MSATLDNTLDSAKQLNGQTAQNRLKTASNIQ